MNVFLRRCGFVLTIGLVGCGEPESKLGLVTGTVTQDGRPVANMALEFHPDSGGRPSLAISNEEGKFEAIYLAQVPGAAVGSHSIRYELVPGTLPSGMSPEKMAKFEMPRLDEGVYLTPTSVRIRRGENRLELKLIRKPIVDNFADSDEKQNDSADGEVLEETDSSGNGEVRPGTP